MSTDATALARWRLVLGPRAEPGLGIGSPTPTDAALDRVLEFVYGREYAGRGVRGDERGAGRGAGAPSVPEWVREMRELFPAETVEVIQSHALERYGMTELVSDPEVLRRLEPSFELLQTLLAFRDLLSAPVLDLARRIVRHVVEDLRRRLASEVRPILWGRLDRRRRSRLRIARNLDWHRTIRANLRRYDRERRRLVLERVHFLSRVERHIGWHVILAVDTSGSMLPSVIHSAVMASILHALPTVRVEFVAFDTRIVDLTARVDDPAELLLSVQLGGGTDIAGALEHCETRVTQPSRTVVIVVTDFHEGGSLSALEATIRRLRGAGTRVLGLAALDERARPAYDRAVAERCADAGAEIAALTPGRLAEWLGRVLS